MKGPPQKSKGVQTYAKMEPLESLRLGTLNSGRSHCSVINLYYTQKTIQILNAM